MTIKITNKVFISNLVQACQKNSYINEEGKKLSFFQRISHGFSWKKHMENEFQLVCKRLSNITDLSTVTTSEQLDILIRLKKIHEKIKDKNIQSECKGYLESFENVVLNDQTRDICLSNIFTELNQDLEKTRTRKIDGDFQRIGEVVQHFAKEEKSLQKIIGKWNDFNKEVYSKQIKKNHVVPPNSFQRYMRHDQHISRKLLNAEEKILLKKSTESSNEYSVLLKRELKKLIQHLPLKRLKKPTADQQLISQRIQTFKEILDKNSENKVFVSECLKEINNFFDEVNCRLELPEYEKNKWMIFQDLFPIIDEHINKLDDEDLKLRIKARFANLPSEKERSDFPNLFFSQKDQVTVLCKHLQYKEEFQVNSLIADLKNLSRKDCHQLAKLVSPQGYLSQTNREAIKKNLMEIGLEGTSIDWDSVKEVETYLLELFLPESGKKDIIAGLTRTSRSKKFFQDQLNLDESMIIIPRWFHSTNRLSAIKGILKTNLEVRHERVYRGAWVSSQIEHQFGHYTLAYRDQIKTLDQNVFIGFRYEDRRWRGLQKPININSDHNNPNLAVVAVTTRVDKQAQKVDKLHLIKILKENKFPNPRAFSLMQLLDLQRESATCLGLPNLSSSWWGKNDGSLMPT